MFWAQQKKRTKRAQRRLAACSYGSIAVELALIAPVALALMVGGVEASSLIRNQMLIQNAARVGTQYALVRPAQIFGPHAGHFRRTANPPTRLGDGDGHSTRVGDRPTLLRVFGLGPEQLHRVLLDR